MRAKRKSLQKDKIKHKVVSYFVLRRLSKRLPLKVAQKLTYLAMTSKELLDMFGLGTPEREDMGANKKGIEEASKDIINKKPYRYRLGTKRFIKDLLKYLHLSR